jgi:hypothetical protein
MSDQQAPVPGQSQQGPPPGVGAKPYDLQKCAHDAQVALEKLATELGKSDADPQVIQGVSGYADDMGKLAKSFSKLMDTQHQEPAPPQETMDSATQGLADAARRPQA